MILVRHGQSEFNVIFNQTRKDPGIRDPKLTPEGRRQIAEAAEAMVGEGVKRIIASPYTRALETAEIIASHLDLPITVEREVGERAVFVCDVGSSCAELKTRWPHIALDHLPDPWWPTLGETEEALDKRIGIFRKGIADRVDWREIAVVSHWGVIRSLTGLAVTNGSVLRIDPTRPEHPAECLYGEVRPAPPGNLPVPGKSPKA